MNDLIQEEIRGYENLDHWEKDKDESLPVSHPPKNDETTSSPPRRPSKSMMELLATFDPDKKPQDDAPLEEIQLWLECFSQQETVKKFEEMLQNARERQDYASISIVQRQMLEWYQPLREKILEEQKGYFEKQKNKGANKYGPFLCTLQPEKLAIIASHEATMYALKMGGNGATLMKMALLIGDAIEAEVNVQRLLRQRMRRKEKTAVQTMDDDLDQQQQQQQLEEGREYEGQGVLQDDKIENEMNNVHHQEKKDQTLDWMYGPSHLQKFVEEMNRLDPTRKGKMRIARANRRAMQLLESAEPWTTADKVILGAVLIQMLLEVAKVSFPGQRGVKPAFEYEKLWIGDKKLVGYITMNDNLYKRFVEDKFSSVDAFTTRHKPMVVPPREWVGPDEGGYMLLQTEFMRAHGCHVQKVRQYCCMYGISIGTLQLMLLFFKSALAEADLRTVMDGLNALGKVPWAINKKILNVAQRCWDEGIALGDIPSRTDFELPPMPIRPEGGHKDYVSADGEFQRYRDALSKYRRVYQRNMDLRSLRCSALLKLNQAHQFKDFEKIYFPYNVDFRGRAYPVPPHLSNIGSDLCRGVLTFAESKPLGPRGLYWMKVHLANLAGNDKITFDQRAEFTENNMDNIRAAVDDPFGENRWWMTLDDPFQALATCHEIVNAIDSGDPENYQSSLPVHMDGSCNGLQHYAALGRDRVGGKAVNLCAYDAPQDVYSGVMREVIKRVAEEAERMLDIDATRDDLTKAEREALANNRAAKLTNGLIDRGVVKRTVMTSVYGVTYIGAKKQIQEKIEEKVRHLFEF
jgi:DNA-directed RNA polymerase